MICNYCFHQTGQCTCMASGYVYQEVAKICRELGSVLIVGAVSGNEVVSLISGK